MDRITLLDCTLRDGGYINDWRFGKEAIVDIIDKLEDAKVDILELGFMKNEPYLEDRTVFNSMSQVKKIIGKKQDGVQYAVMAEVVNPMPLEKIEPADDEGPDIFRVIVWKTKHNEEGRIVDALQEGYEYCKGIVEKGYKLCVQPARVDQYSDEEFVAMIQLFQQLDPYAIYVVDSWGTRNPEELLHYMHLADDNMKPGIALGYHGHNNMMQALSGAQMMLAENFNRNVMIDASVYGIGRGAGNLNSEIIAKYLNERYGKAYVTGPMVQIYDKYIKEIYEVEQWGYSVPYYLTAKYNCNPNYALCFANELLATDEEIEAVLQMLSDKERIMFSKKVAKEKLIQLRHDRKKLCIIIPTANRANDIEYYLRMKYEEYALFGVDIIIFDSSDDDKTERVVKKYQDREDSTVIYHRYTGYFDGVSIDHKVMKAYEMYASQYEYLWPCRDGLLINIREVYRDLLDAFEQKVDSVIVYAWYQNYEGLPERQSQSDCREILVQHCRHMAILGASIFSSHFIKAVLESEPVDEIKNYGLWQPMAMFHYWAIHTPNVVSLVRNVFTLNTHVTSISFWNKKGRALWQWGKRWYEMVNALPAEYDAVKKDIMIIEMADFTPFAQAQLVIMRANGSLTRKTFQENKEYLAHVTHVPLRKINLIAWIPQSICRFYANNMGSPKAILLKKTFNFCKEIYKKLKKTKTIQIPNYDMGERVFFPSIGKNTNIFAKGQLCIVIPTKNRTDILKDNFVTALETYCAFGIDVIIVDSSKDELTKEVVLEWQKKVGSSLQYWFWDDSNANPRSIDEKVISIYEEYGAQYEYVWVLRDKLAINVPACIVDLKRFIEQKTDLIIFNNQEQKEPVVYRDNIALFKDCFNTMTVLGQTIVRSEFVLNCIERYPLDEKANLGMWQPIVFFHYIEKQRFSAVLLTGWNLFIYHPEALKGSFWYSQFMYQWVDRWYEMLSRLPNIYRGVIYEIIIEMNEKFNLYNIGALLLSRSLGGLTAEDVEQFRDIIPQVTTTSMETFEEVSKLTRKQAKKGYDKLLTRNALRYLKKNFPAVFLPLDYSHIADFASRKEER